MYLQNRAGFLHKGLHNRDAQPGFHQHATLTGDTIGTKKPWIASAGRVLGHMNCGTPGM